MKPGACQSASGRLGQFHPKTTGGLEPRKKAWFHAWVPSVLYCCQRSLTLQSKATLQLNHALLRGVYRNTLDEGKIWYLGRCLQTSRRASVNARGETSF